MGIGKVMPRLNLKSHLRRKGKPIGYKESPRTDVEAVSIRSSSKWTRLSRQIRCERPICEECLNKGGPLKPSQEVHHIVKVQSNPNLAFDPANLMALCKECHLEIENRENG